MFLAFFTELRAAKVPVTLREYLTLLEALDQDLAEKSVEDFYYLSRACLVKDERNLDKFDRVFGQVFKGLESLGQALEAAEIPEEWLRKLAERYLTEEEKSADRGDGLGQAVRDAERASEGTEGPPQGGSKWIGTGGTSPFGAYGYNPEGIRIGQDGNRNFRAVKVWDKREFKDLDDTVELGVRNMRIALRRLRRFARTGAPEELDLDGTIQETAHKGYLDVRCAPSGATPSRCCCSSTSAARWTGTSRRPRNCFRPRALEFKRFEHFYFHNCLYERVWKENRRRHAEITPTLDVIRTYPSDYRVVFVGDASMSPYEILMPGGSVEHWNEEPGQVWLERAARPFP